MEMKRKYMLSPELILKYLYLMGVDKKHIDAKEVSHYSKEGIRNIYDLYSGRVCDYIDTLPSSSYELARMLGEILERSSSSREGASLEDILHLQAILSILEKVTNLNLLEEDTENYILLFERINSIYKIVLTEMFELTPLEIISLNQKTADFKRTYLNNLSSSKTPILIVLLYLATRSKENIKDYEMFNEGTAIINYEKLMSLVGENLGTSTLDAINNRPNPKYIFPRQSYYNAYKSMNTGNPDSGRGSR